MKAVILQPGYIPWCGFFDQMAQSDVFIIYDNVQFDKHGWRNRNRIKTPQGIQWLTVPVLTKGQSKPKVSDIRIDNHINWRDAHLKSIKQNYSKSPFFADYIGVFCDLYSSDWEYLVHLDVAVIIELRHILGIKSALKLASSIGVTGDRTERLVKMCLEVGADEFIEGRAGQGYLEGAGERAFADNGIKLTYHDYPHPVYPQLYGEFVPYLSVIDLLFNCGPDSLARLTGKLTGDPARNPNDNNKKGAVA